MSDNLATRQPNNTTALDVHHTAWAGSANRKQRAATAANEHDADTLWSLCSAMLHEGGVSRHTAKAYRLGAVAFIAWACLAPGCLESYCEGS